MKKINIEFLRKTDLQLQDLHLEQTPEGKAARKEIQSTGPIPSSNTKCKV